MKEDKKLENLIEKNKIHIETTDSEVSECKTRITTSEQNVLALQQHVERILSTKADKLEFLKTKKAQSLDSIRMDLQLTKQENHIKTLDNYLHKYMPIRMQNQMNETFSSFLIGTEKRRFTIYTAEKSYYLYKNLLKDKGRGKIAEICR